MGNGIAGGSNQPAASYQPRPVDRFMITYVLRELQGRLRQGLLIALGLGFGVGLVITVIAASAGISDAQKTVLHSLDGIGTDLTITKPVPAPQTPAPGGSPGGLEQPSALQPTGIGLLPSTWVASVSRLAHVASAAGGLELSQITLLHGVPLSVPVEGVDPARTALGPLASGRLSEGRTFRPSDDAANVAVIDSTYAISNQLSIGSTITLGDAPIHVIGTVGRPQGSGGTDIYIPLATAQTLARSANDSSLTGYVNVIYVAADSSTTIPAVHAEIARLLPTVTITSTSDLAGQISGSLASAATLTNDLGRWVAAAALIAAFALASLLTMASVTRRFRELGTLKALGWSTRRIITQIVSESLPIGVIGALIGIGVGLAGTALIGVIAPNLSASVPGNGAAGNATVAVHLATHASPTAIAVAVALALSGALLAGSIGAWRATRLQPASAFTQVQ
jgi:putative ABC transport system permease protein